VVGDVVMLERVDDFVFNGQPGQVPVVGVMEIEDGKVSAWREYYDYATLEHALMPPADQMAQAIAAQIETLTEKLETDWNSGDMDAYLAAYWNDANMSLMFGDGGLRGWQAVKDLFSSSWTTEEAMGDFEVDEMEVRMIRPDIAIASGSFEHRFPAETIVGAFTHVWQHTEGGEWLIVHEHTSRANPPSD